MEFDKLFLERLKFLFMILLSNFREKFHQKKFKLYLKLKLFNTQYQ